MSTPVFRHPHRVTYAECTVGDHVYYSRYLDMLEEARGEFYRSLGFPLRDLQQRDLIFPVVECQIQYKTPAHYDDCLKVEVWLTEMGRVKLRFDYRILREDGTLIVTASTLHVCSSTREKLKRLPAEIAHALQPHLRTAL